MQMYLRSLVYKVTVKVMGNSIVKYNQDKAMTVF